MSLCGGRGKRVTADCPRKKKKMAEQGLPSKSGQKKNGPVDLWTREDGPRLFAGERGVARRGRVSGRIRGKRLEERSLVGEKKRASNRIGRKKGSGFPREGKSKLV